MGQAFLKLLLESKECIMALLTMLGIEDKTDNKKKSVKTRAKKTVAKIGALVRAAEGILNNDGFDNNNQVEHIRAKGESCSARDAWKRFF